MNDQPEPDPPGEPADLENEIEQLEERVEAATTSGARARARRLRTLRRQVRETKPDALFASGGETGFRGIARRTDSYGFVLLLLATLIWVFVPFASQERWATIPTVIVFYLAIIISMHTSFVRERRLVTVAVLDSCFLAIAILGVVIDSEDLRGVGNLGFGLMLIATAAVVLRRVLGHQTVTSRTLSGAVAAFLLLGLAFACFAEATVLWDSTAYASSTTSDFTFATMLYYSFVTIATLGYGDVVPVSDVARPLATAEAVTGQIYLVTIVARLVSLLGLSRFTAADTPPDDPGQT